MWTCESVHVFCVYLYSHHDGIEQGVTELIESTNDRTITCQVICYVLRAECTLPHVHSPAAAATPYTWSILISQSHLAHSFQMFSCCPFLYLSYALVPGDPNHPLPHSPVLHSTYPVLYAVLCAMCNGKEAIYMCRIGMAVMNANVDIVRLWMDRIVCLRAVVMKRIVSQAKPSASGCDGHSERHLKAEERAR